MRTHNILNTHHIVTATYLYLTFHQHHTTIPTPQHSNIKGILSMFITKFSLFTVLKYVSLSYNYVRIGQGETSGVAV